MADTGHTRKHSPQSMHLLPNSTAFPFLIRMASVGHTRMQWEQPMQTSWLKVIAW
jgi:hypothetical protein